MRSELRQTLGHIIARQQDDRGLASHVARGARLETEHEAYPYLSRALAVLDGPARTGFIRACGLAIGLTAGSNQPLGRNLACLSHAVSGRWPGTNPDGIGTKVQLLPHLGLEPAAVVLDGLLRRCAIEGVGVNAFSLADTLMGWESGDATADYRHRNSLIYDFFTPKTTTEEHVRP